MGAIVHNTTGTTFSTASTASRGYWDIDGGGADFAFFLSAYPFTGNRVVASNNYLSGGEGAVNVGGLAIPLSKGAVVGPTLAIGRFAGNATLMYRSTGGYFVNTTAYLGFRFDRNFDGQGGFRYGWAKARTEVFGNDNEGVQLIFSEWAWDDSGAPIEVGDTGEAPAPATVLPTLLGLRAMGVQAYRRWREEGLKRLADEQEGAAA
jgi:hypothetical protein